jgi:hypothetical protein
MFTPHTPLTFLVVLELFFETFPKLQEDGLRELTLGIYQIKLTKTYTKEHLKDGGEYEVLVNKPNENSWERFKVGMYQS